MIPMQKFVVVVLAPFAHPIQLVVVRLPAALTVSSVVLQASAV
jgi:hypothetical protein